MIARIYTVYSLAPIDFEWREIPKLEGHEFEEKYRRAFDYIYKNSVSECDDREKVRISFVPYDYFGDVLFYALFTWKTDNNGTTYVASPIKLYPFEKTENIHCNCWEKETVYIPDSVYKYYEELEDY